MIQAAKIIGTGLATTGLIGARGELSCNNKLQKRYFKTQARHYADNANSNNDSRPNSFATSQEQIQSQAQSQNLEQISTQRRTYANIEDESVSKEWERLNRIERDVITRMDTQAQNNRIDTTNQLGAMTSSLPLSTQTVNEINGVHERFNKVNQSGLNTLSTLDIHDGPGSIQAQYIYRGFNESLAIRNNKILDILLGQNLTDRERSRLLDLRQDVERCRREDVRVSDHKVELAKNWVEVMDRSSKLQENYPRSEALNPAGEVTNPAPAPEASNSAPEAPNSAPEASNPVSEPSNPVSETRSNISDFADPSLEMPSYMDPED